MTEEDAQERAVASGVPVEITAQRDAYSTVFANPDGSRSAEVSAAPVRVRRADGWVPVDTTLTKTASGEVAPVATAMEMKFSGGGNGPLAQLSSGAVSLSLSFPVELPEPTLEANAATYAEVYPGVDLLVRAEADSFSHVLVVKNEEAGRNDAVREVVMAAAAPGATVEESQGGVKVTGPDGVSGIDAPEPVMWDSSGVDGGAAAEAREEAPQTGDDVAPVGVEVTGGSVVLAPSAGLLDDPATEYPVYIDPTYSPTKSAWGMVFKQHPNTPYFKWGGTDGEGVGFQDFKGLATKRLFWNFPTKTFRGTKIKSATFSAYEIYAISCVPTRLDLYKTALVHSGSTWNDQPAWQRFISSRTVAYGRDGCMPGGESVEWNAQEAVQLAADARVGTMGLGLRAFDETDNLSWKRFKNSARLSVVYNTPPDVPDSLRTVEPATECKTGYPQPKIPLETDGPTLTADLDDPDEDQFMRAQFELYESGIDPGEEPIWRPFSPSGGSFRDPTDPSENPIPYQATVPVGLLEAGKIYTWRLRAQDKDDDDGGLWSPWSTRCQFQVDATLPPEPEVTDDAGGSYALGDTVAFTFSPGAASAVDHYQWSFNSTALNQSVDATNPTVTVTLTHTGPSVLRVRSVSATGVLSAQTAVEFNTIGTAQEAAHFALDEGTGTTSVDRKDGSRSLSWPAGSSVTWVRDGPVAIEDAGLLFAGDESAAYSPGGVIATNESFTVTAFVRPTGPGAGETVAISQAGTGGAVFVIGVTDTCAPPSEGGVAPTSCYFARLREADGTTAQVESRFPPDWDSGMWQHLAVTFAPGPAQLKLWVDASQDGVADVGFQVPASSGAFCVGGVGTGATGLTGGFVGYVDEVRVFRGVLDGAQVSSLQFQA